MYLVVGLLTLLMPKLFFSINPCNPQINVNLQLLMVEVEYERVARVCNNVFL